MKKTSKRTSGSRKPSRRRPATRKRAKAWKLPHEVALAAFGAVAERLRIRWYVFGAHAVNLHGFPRATADLDITVDTGDRSVVDLVDALEQAGFEPRFRDDEFIATTRVIPVVHRASGLPIDFVLAGPGLEQRFLDEVEHHRIGELEVPVLSIENLIVTKLLAGRPKDLQDVRELLGRSTIDHEQIDSLLVEIEDALGQSDLRPLYRTLRGR